MIYLITFVLIGVIFIALLLLWVFLSESPSNLGEANVDSFLLEDLHRPDRVLIDRLFDRADWDWLSKETTPQVARTLLRDRTRLAIAWLHYTQRQAAQLMKLHRRMVRGNVELKPCLEIKLAMNYLAFLLLCSLLHVVILARGPLRAAKMARYAFRVADTMWFVSEQALGRPELRTE
jgi:hypothetical protein